MAKRVVFFLLLLVFTGSVSALDIVGDELTDNIIRLSKPDLGTTGNASFNESLTDLLYWRLDGTNSPPSADWEMGGFDFQEVGRIDLAVSGNNPVITAPSTYTTQIESTQINFIDEFDSNVELEFEQEYSMLYSSALDLMTFDNGESQFNDQVTFFDTTRATTNWSVPFLGDATIFWDGDEFVTETENSKSILYNEPNQANDFKVFQIFSKQAQSETEFTITKAGNNHASYFVRSLALVGNSTTTPTPFNCSTYADHIDCQTDLTGADLFVSDSIEFDGLIYGNGSQLQDVCLSNGTGCVPSGGGDLTNVAFLNTSQTFVETNTFENITLFKDAININMSNGKNITWRKQLDTDYNCIRFTGSGTFSPQGICTVNNLQMEIIGVALKMGFQTIQMGRNDSDSYTFDIDTRGDSLKENTKLVYQGGITGDGLWEFHRPISWEFNTLPVLIPSDIFPANNVTFDNFFGTSATLNGISLIDINGAVAEDFHYNMTLQEGGVVMPMVRQNDTSIGSTSYINDEFLFSSVENGKNYSFEVFLHIQGGTTNDDAWINISAPAGDLKVFNEFDDASAFNRIVCDNYDLNNMGEIGSDCDNIAYQTAGGEYTIFLSGSYFAEADGTFRLQYRENNNVGGDYSVNKGSYLTISESL